MTSRFLSAELSATCNALGYSSGTTYYTDPYVKETITDLIRYLRRDDEDHTIRRHLGRAKVLQTDLLPILIHHSDKEELFDVVLRLLVNLTNPALLVYKEQLPSDPTGRHNYLEINTHLQNYKEAFTQQRVWEVLTQKLEDLLKIEYHERDEDQSRTMERILILTRNVLKFPADPDAEKRPDNDASVHDQVLWSLHQAGMVDLFLYIASTDREQQYCMHILEVVSLMLREQTPATLASAALQRSVEEKERDEKELLEIRQREVLEKQSKVKKYAGSRHSNFGGTYIVKDVKSISDNDLIFHKPLNKAVSLSLDFEKQRARVPRNRVALSFQSSERRSAFSVRLFLKEFCVEFLNGAYNKLMNKVRENLLRAVGQQHDETYYFWAMKFFMEFNRLYKFQVKLISETMHQEIFHFVHTQMDNWLGHTIVDKKNIPIWSRRIHQALQAYQELLMTLQAMDKSPDGSVRQSAKVIKSNIFYQSEYRELVIYLFNVFTETKFSREFLKDLVETTHIFLKMLEQFCSKHQNLVVQGKARKKSKKKTSKKSVAEGGVVNLEAIWDEVGPELSAVLQGHADIPADIIPFDAASDIPMEQQKVEAMRNIQYELKQRNFEQAVGLLRASREVWPENNCFGQPNMPPDEEFMAMKDIFMADIDLPAVVPPPAQEEESEDEEDDEEGDSRDIVVPETVLKFSDFVARFASPKVLVPVCLLLEDFTKNSTFTNHCIVKLLHRVAWDCKIPAMLLHANFLQTLQKILDSTKPEHKELSKFAKFITRKAVEIAEKNENLYTELMLWKNSKEAYEVESGYGTSSDATSHSARNVWREEQEDELRRLAQEYEENTPEPDAVGWIMKNMIDQTRSRRAVIKKLKELYLVVGNIKPKKPKDMREEEISELRVLYEQFKDSIDPMNCILGRLSTPRSRNVIASKLLELGLISDRKELRKKRTKGKTGKSAKVLEWGDRSDDESIYDSWSDEDATASAASMKKKNSKVRRVGQPSQAQMCCNLKKVMDGGDKLREALEWLQSSLEEVKKDLAVAGEDELEEVKEDLADAGEDELEEVKEDLAEAGEDELEEVKEDLADAGEDELEEVKEDLADAREDELEEVKEDLADAGEDEEGTALLPLAQSCVEAMDNPVFLQLLDIFSIDKPTDQEVYWRIPGCWKEEDLSKRIDLIKDALEGRLPEVDPDEVEELIRLPGTSKTKPEGEEKKNPKKKGKKLLEQFFREDNDNIGENSSDLPSVSPNSDEEDDASPLSMTRRNSYIETDSDSVINFGSENSDSEQDLLKSQDNKKINIHHVGIESDKENNIKSTEAASGSNVIDFDTSNKISVNINSQSEDEIITNAQKGEIIEKRDKTKKQFSSSTHSEDETEKGESKNSSYSSAVSAKSELSNTRTKNYGTIKRKRIRIESDSDEDNTSLINLTEATDSVSQMSGANFKSRDGQTSKKKRLIIDSDSDDSVDTVVAFSRNTNAAFSQRTETSARDEPHSEEDNTTFVDLTVATDIVGQKTNFTHSKSQSVTHKPTSKRKRLSIDSDSDDCVDTALTFTENTTLINLTDANDSVSQTSGTNSVSQDKQKNKNKRLCIDSNSNDSVGTAVTFTENTNTKFSPRTETSTRDEDLTDAYDSVSQTSGTNSVSQDKQKNKNKRLRIDSNSNDSVRTAVTFTENTNTTFSSRTETITRDQSHFDEDEDLTDAYDSVSQTSGTNSVSQDKQKNKNKRLHIDSNSNDSVGTAVTFTENTNTTFSPRTETSTRDQSHFDGDEDLTDAYDSVSQTSGTNSVSQDKQKNKKKRLRIDSNSNDSVGTAVTFTENTNTTFSPRTETITRDQSHFDEDEDLTDAYDSVSQTSGTNSVSQDKQKNKNKRLHIDSNSNDSVGTAVTFTENTNTTFSPRTETSTRDQSHFDGDEDLTDAYDSVSQTSGTNSVSQDKQKNKKKRLHIDSNSNDSVGTAVTFTENTNTTFSPRTETSTRDQSHFDGDEDLTDAYDSVSQTSGTNSVSQDKQKNKKKRLRIDSNSNDSVGTAVTFTENTNTTFSPRTETITRDQSHFDEDEDLTDAYDSVSQTSGTNSVSQDKQKNKNKRLRIDSNSNDSVGTAVTFTENTNTTFSPRTETSTRDQSHLDGDEDLTDAYDSVSQTSGTNSVSQDKQKNKKKRLHIDSNSNDSVGTAVTFTENTNTTFSPRTETSTRDQSHFDGDEDLTDAYDSVSQTSGTNSVSQDKQKNKKKRLHIDSNSNDSVGTAVTFTENTNTTFSPRTETITRDQSHFDEDEDLTDAYDSVSQTSGTNSVSQDKQKNKKKRLRIDSNSNDSVGTAVTFTENTNTTFSPRTETITRDQSHFDEDEDLTDAYDPVSQTSGTNSISQDKQKNKKKRLRIDSNSNDSVGTAVTFTENTNTTFSPRTETITRDQSHFDDDSINVEDLTGANDPVSQTSGTNSICQDEQKNKRLSIDSNSEDRVNTVVTFTENINTTLSQGTEISSRDQSHPDEDNISLADLTETTDTASQMSGTNSFSQDEQEGLSIDSNSDDSVGTDVPFFGNTNTTFSPRTETSAKDQSHPDEDNISLVDLTETTDTASQTSGTNSLSQDEQENEQEGLSIDSNSDDSVGTDVTFFGNTNTTFSPRTETSAKDQSHPDEDNISLVDLTETTDTASQTSGTHSLSQDEQENEQEGLIIDSNSDISVGTEVPFTGNTCITFSPRTETSTTDQSDSDEDNISVIDLAETTDTASQKSGTNSLSQDEQENEQEGLGNNLVSNEDYTTFWRSPWNS